MPPTPRAPAATSRPVLPVDQTVQFNLHSPNVIHSFGGITGFLMRMDVIRGRVNHYEVTPDTEGTFAGKCYELCGVSHAQMLFNVEVVSAEEYEAYLGSSSSRATRPTCRSVATSSTSRSASRT